MNRLPVRALDPTGGTEGQVPRIVGGVVVYGTPAGGAGGSDGASDPVGLNLTKQGIVIAKGAAGAWDADMVESVTIINDPKSGRMAGVYTGYGTVGGVQRAGAGLAYSTDGITWTKQGSAAMLPHSGVSGDPDENGVTGPLLLWDDAVGQYVLYYVGLTVPGYEGGVKSLCYATATSLAGPWTRHGAVITPSSAGTGWRTQAVWHPSIVVRDGVFYLFFNATGGDAKERIGYATAPALTGPWTVDDTNSPLINTGAGWEAGIVGDPSVRRVGDMWVMAYYGTNSTTSAASDGIAVTSDHDFPLGWVKYPSNPVLAPGAAYDAMYAHKPFVMVRGGVLFHYYTAVSAANVRQIALAVETPSTPASTPAPTPPLVVKDEGSTIEGAASSINFTGASVAAATDGSGHVTISLTGSTGLRLWTSTNGAGAPDLMWDDNGNLIYTEET